MQWNFKFWSTLQNKPQQPSRLGYESLSAVLHNNHFRDACNALAAVQQKLNDSPDIKSINLSFRGIGDFYGKVIYLKPMEDENLAKFRNLASNDSAQGFSITVGYL